MLCAAVRSRAVWQWVAAGAEAFQAVISEASGSGSRLCDTYMYLYLVYVYIKIYFVVKSEIWVTSVINLTVF